MASPSQSPKKQVNMTTTTSTMPMCFNTFICRFSFRLSLIMASVFQCIHIDYMAMTTAMATATAIDMPKNCLRVYVFFVRFASHIDWFRLSIRWSRPLILYVRVRVQLVFMSISHFTTFQRDIMPFSMSTFMLCCADHTHKYIQNYNDKMQHK